MTADIADEYEALAADYALGVLTESERADVDERLIAEPRLAAQVAEWQTRLAPLVNAAEEIEPPVELFARIESAIERQNASGAKQSVTVRSDEGRWIDFAPGARKKILYFDDKAKKEAFILELDPGCVLPEHDHHATEDCLVMDGDFWIGDLELKAGDFHAAFAPSRHAPCRSENGCRLFIKAAA